MIRLRYNRWIQDAHVIIYGFQVIYEHFCTWIFVPHILYMVFKTASMPIFEKKKNIIGSYIIYVFQVVYHSLFPWISLADILYMVFRAPDMTIFKKLLSLILYMAFRTCTRIFVLGQISLYILYMVFRTLDMTIFEK